MRVLISGLLTANLLCLSNSVMASDDNLHTLGVVSTATVVDYGNGEDSAAGFGINYQRLLARYPHFDVAGAVTYADMTHINLSQLKVRNLDGNLFIGRNLHRHGLHYFAGAGLFTETWSSSGSSRSYNGAQLLAGVGYNFERISVQGWFSIRDASAYALSGSEPNSVGYGVFAVSYRF
ncbi:MAG: hypothetical protein JJU10_10305 [Idiomarina sp.]|nr:hypothetical protein [Idiomarina sp.]